MTAHEAGKGDKQRPTNWEHFSENFDRIFGKTKKDWKKEVEEQPKKEEKKDD